MACWIFRTDKRTKKNDRQQGCHHPIFHLSNERKTILVVKKTVFPYLGVWGVFIPYFCCMIEITDQLVEHLADLSRLEFDDRQKVFIKSDLQKIIQFMEKLNELDTTGVAPLLHISTRTNVLREDEVSGSVTREEGLKNAPATDGEFFKVPKVIQK